jgi:DNA polymerase delta subunit 1
VRNVLTLDTCNSIPGADVQSFQTESKMLLQWEKFVQWTDPDIFLGYNITNFDFPYILNRAEHL